MTLKVGINGVAGKMGSTTKAALQKEPSLELRCEIDQRFSGKESSPADAYGSGEKCLQAASLDNLERLCVANNQNPRDMMDILIDFTDAETLFATALWCVKSGVHLVSGSTGLSEEKTAHLEALFADPKAPNCVLAPNFSISALVLMHLAKVAAPYFDSVEIIELHHDEKKDAPSGTAVATARHIAGSLEKAGVSLRPDPTETEKIQGARGAEAAHGIKIHAVRLHGLVAHEEVLFGSTGQSLTLRQDSYDRTSFMPGVMLAAKSVSETQGMTLGLEKLLNLS